MLPCHASLLAESTQQVNISKSTNCKQQPMPDIHVLNGMVLRRMVIKR